MPEDYDHPSGTGAGSNADADRDDRPSVNSNPETARNSAADSSTEFQQPTRTGSSADADTARTSGSESTTRMSSGQLPQTPQDSQARPAEAPDAPTRPVSTAGAGSESPTERTQSISPVPASAADFAGAFPEGDNERTQSLSRVPAAEPTATHNQTATWSTGGSFGSAGSNPPPPSDPPGGRPPGGGGQQPPGGGNNRGNLVRAGVIAGIVVTVLVVLYAVDIAVSSGKVPRGTVVADVEIGGMDQRAAERTLRNQLSPELSQPVTIKVGDTVERIDPDQAGLRMNWPATVHRAGTQPWSPITRLTSLFTSREVAPVSQGDRTQVRKELERVKPKLDREPAEGTIRFEGTQPVAVDPVTGRSVDLAAATDTVVKRWASKGPVQVPFTEQQVSTTTDGVRKALKDVAQPAVAGPVTVRGEGKDAILGPEAIAKFVKFEPDGEGGLKSSLDMPAAIAAAEPQLAPTMRPGIDAQIALEGGKPSVKPSTDGRGIDWNKSFERLPEVLKQRNDRNVQATYRHEPPKLTTDQANQLGIREVVSEFESGGFDPNSGVNIRRVAEQVNGAIVKPGDMFSLNGHTGPRGLPQGYVESGIIQDGRPQKSVGGGISQFATTIYNASYFAGMQDVEHKEHSYYISRYPQGREATVFQAPDGKSVIDVKFKNVSQHGIMITTEWTPSSIKIKFWGTKQFEVGSETSPQSEPMPPQVKSVPPGEPCTPSTGKPGFTVFDTRTVKDLATGKVTKEKPSKTEYDPHPSITCGPPPPA